MNRLSGFVQQTRSGRWVLLLVISLGCAALFALVATWGDFVQQGEQAQQGSTRSFGRIFSDVLVPWLLAGSLVPVIVALAVAFPFGEGQLLRRVSIHIVAAFAFPIVHFAALQALNTMEGQSPARFFGGVKYLVGMYGVWDVLTYVAVVGIVHAFAYQRRYRERELAATKLRADLSEARLLALRRQLEPHFLFNTLNAGVVLARRGESARVAQMLMMLSELLRRVLRVGTNNSSQHVESLGEELSFLRQYLAIQQLRFGGRLSVRLDVPDDLHGVMVPIMILQPLVENAMQHAVESRAGACSIHVVARRVDGTLCLDVADDGPGLPHGWSFAHDAGVGLRNTQARLVQLFGDGASVSVVPVEGGGATARVRIPLGTPPANFDA